jgi:hypothetical protein
MRSPARPLSDESPQHDILLNGFTGGLVVWYRKVLYQRRVRPVNSDGTKKQEKF